MNEEITAYIAVVPYTSAGKLEAIQNTETNPRTILTICKITSAILCFIWY